MQQAELAISSHQDELVNVVGAGVGAVVVGVETVVCFYLAV